MNFGGISKLSPEPNLSDPELIGDIATAAVIIELSFEYIPQLIQYFKLPWHDRPRVSVVKALHILAPLLVIGGITGELLFHHWASMRQREKIFTLEEKLAPRQLADFGKIGRTAETIREHVGTPFDLSVEPAGEPIRFLNELEDALIAGGWVERPVRTDFPTFNRDNRPLVGVRIVSGVQIVYLFHKASPLGEAAAALASALKDEKIDAEVFVMLHDDDPSKEDRLHIWIGEKP